MADSLTGEALLRFVDSEPHHGCVASAARALGVSRSTLRGRIEAAKSGRPMTTRIKPPRVPQDAEEPPPPAPAALRETDDGATAGAATDEGPYTLDDLMRDADVDRERWAVERWKANSWVSGDRRVWQVTAHLQQRTPGLEPVQPVAHLRREARPLEPGALRQALIVPDSQHGFRHDRERGTLDPLHDRRACDLAVQLAQLLQPEIIVLLGDMLDLAPWSTKYTASAALRYTTQASLIELHWFIGRLRTAAPGARIVYLEGNHEHRIEKAIVAMLPEAEGLRPADDTRGPALLSIPRLLGLAALDVEYHGPYGAEVWLWDQVRVHHGHTVRKRAGATAAAVLGEATHSEVYGHIHRCELAWRTLHGPGGRRTRIFSGSPGTLCRIDGVVPAATPRVDWQQGAMVLTRCDDGAVWPQIVPFEDGRALFGGNLLVGEAREAELSADTGWRFAESAAA